LTSFTELNLPSRLVETLRRMDVMEPTPIQEATIEELVAGHDVVGQARTGSGKTLAFGIPIMALCDPDLAAPQALVLVPTRELAGQVARVIDKLTPTRGLRAAQIYGGRDMGDQIALLNTGPQIVIGTPGRLLDHLYRGSLALRHLRIMVLDEADQMLDQGFGPDVDLILDCAPAKLQMALFSATIPEWVHQVISHRLHEPRIIKVDEMQKGPNECVEHTVIEVPTNRKLDALRELLGERGGGNIIVFVRTKIGVERLERQISAMGFPVSALQGNQSQGQRERVLRGFRRGNPPIMVATNVAARGLDILAIEQVVNFDVPDSPELLTHRLGRTGRMGRRGLAVTLVTPNDERKWRLIERITGAKITRERFGQPAQPAEDRRPVATPQPVSTSESPAVVPAGAMPTNVVPTTVASPEHPARRRARGGRRSPRTQHAVTCATCKRETTVSFVPRDDRPVYCNTCFRERKEKETAA